MTLDEMLSAIFPPSTGSITRPSAAQRAILEHPSGPAWVLAGPGSGKTDTLALFVLRLVFVDRVAPEAVFATTFTEKAARNLEDRIADYRGRLSKVDPAVASVDLSKLRLGTLHGLCNDVLQEFRAENYQNVRLMDEFETAMFINEHIAFVKQRDLPAVEFWRNFDYLFSRQQWQPTYDTPPRWGDAARALSTLFNRIVDDNVDVKAMRSAGGAWAKLADLYDEYLLALERHYRCDFTHLQRRFLDFLDTPTGAEFRNGNAERPAVAWVLVDEYQDTNLVQEAIYLRLAERDPHNIVVVGDDDQAMYRFRGGSVECMVTFDDACAAYLGIADSSVQRYPLVDNYRSHPAIVKFCSDFIECFSEMGETGARAPGKMPLVASSAISGDYDAVGTVEGQTLGAAADTVAQTIYDLVANGVATDYSQCCILLKSTKEGPRNAGPFVDALRARGIPVYNPRNKGFLEQEEVLALLGALLAVVDPDGKSAPPPVAREVFKLVSDSVAAYSTAATNHKALRDWVRGAVKNIEANAAKKFVPIGLQDLLYLLLSLEPFRSWQSDIERRLRLAKITSLIESYASLPVPDRPQVRRGSLRVADDGNGIVPAWNRQFYNLFFGYLAAQGVNDEEDDDVIVPLGAVPIMTMHQAKGLEFPFVFVGHMGDKHEASAAHRLEDAFSAFPGNPKRVFVRADADTRAKLDQIRRYYVAYSRAEYGLMMVGSKAHFKAGAVPCGSRTNWLREQVKQL